MTISNTSNRVVFQGPGNGFTYNRPVFAEEDIYVEILTTAGDTIIPVLDGAGTFDFTVTGTFDPDQFRFPNGITVTLNNSLPAGDIITVENRVSLTQSSDYVNGGPLNAERLETDIDRLVVMAQAPASILNDVVRISPASGFTLPPLISAPSEFLRWNSTGDAIESADITPTGSLGIPVTIQDGGTGASTVGGAQDNLGITPVIDPESFGAAGDGTTDDTAAFSSWHTASEAVTGGVPLRLRAGSIYRVTSSLDFTDATQPVVIKGPGQRTCAIYGDFTGPGDAIVDISFTTNGNRISGHHLEGFAVFSNGVVGDPMGVKALRSQQQTIEDIFIPGDGPALLGASRFLLNTGMMLTEVNNTDVNNCVVHAGYQPQSFELSTTARFSTSGTTLTADEAVFEAAMVGQHVIFSEGLNSSDSTNYFNTTIASFTNSTTVELDDAPPMDLTDAQMSFGGITGSMTASDATLTTSAVLTSAHEGMRVYIPLAHTKTNAGNTEGLLCTSIVSVTSASECELADAPDVNVTGQPIIFPPAMFIGSLAEEEGENRQTNDCVLNQVQFEGFQSVGLVVNKAIALYLDNCKLHCEGPANSPNRFGRSMFCAVLSDINNIEISSTPLSFQWMTLSGQKGQIWMQGSRGQLILDDFETTGLLQDSSVVVMSGQTTSSCRTIIGPGWITDGLDKHTAGWKPVQNNGPGFYQYGGTINERHGALTFGQVSGELKSIELYRKTMDQSVNNSETLVDINDLTFPIGSDERVYFRATLAFTGPSAADIDFAVNVPSGATIQWSWVNGVTVDNSLTPVAGTGVTTAEARRGTDGSNRYAEMVGHVSNGSTAGNVTVQFAQGVATVGGTVVRADMSRLEVMRL